MLEEQQARISFFGGLDTKSDQYQVVAGKLLLAENVVFPTPGKLKKRNGYGLLDNTIGNTVSTLASGALLTTYQSQAVVGSGNELYSYSQVQETLIDKGVCEACVVTSNPVWRSIYQQTSQDLCVHSAGITLSAWEDTQGGVWYTVYDTQTQQVLLSLIHI